MNRRNFLTSSALTAASHQRVLGANDRDLANTHHPTPMTQLHGDQEPVALCGRRDDCLGFAHQKSRATPVH